MRRGRNSVKPCRPMQPAPLTVADVEAVVERWRDAPARPPTAACPPGCCTPPE